MTGGTPLDVQAILPCNAQQYYVERDSAAFRSLLANALSLGVYKFRDTWKDHNGSTFVRLITKPEISSWVPSALRNAIANASEIEFHDIIEYRPSDISGPSYKLHVRTESPFLGDKLNVTTTLELIRLTENTTLQRLSGTIYVRMFGMGSLIERAIRDNMIKTYQKLPEIVSRWEAYRAELLNNKNGDGDVHVHGVLLAGRPPVGGDLEYIRSIMQGPIQSPLPSPDNKAEEMLSFSEEENEPVEEEKEEKEEEENSIAAPVVLPLHTRRRTASELILDALPYETDVQKESHTSGHTPRHWRGFSWDSVGSQSSEIAPTELEERAPGTKGAYTAWRRFNRDYAVWESYWAQIGVHAATVAQRGVVRVMELVGAELALFGRLLAIVLLLVLVRLHILRVDSSYKSHSSKSGGGRRKQQEKKEKEQEAPQQQEMTRRRSSTKRRRKKSRTSNESVKRSNVSFSASVPVKNPSQTKTYWL